MERESLEERFGPTAEAAGNPTGSDGIQLMNHTDIQSVVKWSALGRGNPCGASPPSPRSQSDRSPSWPVVPDRGEQKATRSSGLAKVNQEAEPMLRVLNQGESRSLKLIPGSDFLAHREPASARSHSNRPRSCPVVPNRGGQKATWSGGLIKANDEGALVPGGLN